MTLPATDQQYCLIVDDEPRLRQVMVHLMRSDGFQCVEAGNGLEAIEQLENRAVTLVLSDLRMPKMDGIELLREIRARFPDTAVVMITAVADVEVAVNCLAIGASDYVIKPYQLEDVRARVAQALEKRRLILENRDYQERLEERVAIQARRLEELFLASIQSLAEALELKDPYTRGHSIRVAHYSSVIARGLGLDGEMLRQIELGGHVHDIGKIGVREAVLNKAGPLTPEEYQHIMTHPVLGWRILSPLLGDTPNALNIVRSHHERFDGRGIPDGLRGTDIPLEARIAAAADALDAMTSDRPYRPSEMTLDLAVDEIRRNGGTQFDPEVVRILYECADRGELELLPRTATHPVVARLTP
ncbi:MAG TPA: HD domain-containing phosphohydrolase [Gemmatimonadaceae bacterium]